MEAHNEPCTVRSRNCGLTGPTLKHNVRADAHTWTVTAILDGRLGNLRADDGNDVKCVQVNWRPVADFYHCTMFSDTSSAEMRVVFARERCAGPVPSTLCVCSRLTNKFAPAKIDNLVIDRIRLNEKQKKKISARTAFVCMGIYTYAYNSHRHDRPARDSKNRDRLIFF